MVNSSHKTRCTLVARDVEEIRFLGFCGLTQAAIADRLGLTVDVVRGAVKRYNLGRPVGELEAVRMELLASYRDTRRRLEVADLSGADHARLCATQVRQATVLMRPLPNEMNIEEAGMSRKSDAARQRLEAMNMEELRNEIRRLAGMELKTLDEGSERRGGTGRGVASDQEPVSDDSDGGAEAAGED